MAKTSDQRKTKAQLIEELQRLRQQVAELQELQEEHKQAGEALAEERNLLRTLIDNLPDSIYAKDTESRFVMGNMAVARVMGATTPDELLGKTDFDFYPQELAAQYYADEQEIIRSGQPLVNREEPLMDRATGKRGWLSTTKVPLRDRQGRVTGLVGIGWDITERKQAEEALRESEERYRSMVESIDIGLNLIDCDHNIVMVNAAQGEKFKKPTREMIGKKCFREFEKRDAVCPHCPGVQAIATGLPAEVETHGVRDDGSRFNVRLRAFPVFGQGGTVGGFIEVAQDITESKQAEAERKQAEETLAEERNLLRTIIDNLPDYIYAKDTESRYFVSNIAHTRFLRATKPDKIVGKTVFELFPQELAAQFYASDQEVIHSGQPLLNREQRSIDAAGNSVWNLTTKVPLRDSDGKIVGLVGISRDITERKRAEEALAEERNLLRTLIDNLPDSIYAKDTESRFVMGNMAVARVMGATTPDELLGKTDFDFYPQELAAQYYADEQEIIRSGQPLVNREEPLMDRATGKRGWLSTTKVPLRDRQGRVTGLVGIGWDITERKRAEEALQKANEELVRRALQLQTAAEVSHTASSILDPDELIQQVVDLASERFDLYYAGLFLVDEAGKWAVLRAGIGEAGQKMLEQGHRLKIGGTSMIGWCVANKQARIALDVGEEAVRFENPLLPETRSELALPLVSRGEVIGALTIQSTQEAAFSEEDIAVLQTMADQLANAIANARLFEALTREQYLMTALMDNLPDAIYFKDTESRFIRINKAHAERWFGLNDPAQAVGKTDFDFFGEEHARRAYEDEREIIRTGQPLVGMEERETWSARPDTWVLTTKMPLRDEQGKVVGTFGLSRDITQRKRAEEALKRRSAQLRVAAEVSHAAGSILDPDELIQQVVDLVRERFDLYYAGLFLVDEAREWAVLWAGTREAGRKMLEQGHRLEVGGESMIGWCVANKQARVALDVGEEAVRFNNPLLPETRSELALPLVSRGQAIGALTIQSTQEAAFSEEDIAVLQTMADQLANAISNARLYEQAQWEIAERKRAEEALARQARALDAELEQFFYVASHHLQEPLRMVVSYSQLLERRYKGRLDEDADEIIAYAVDGATRIQALVNDVLAFSRVTTRAQPFAPTDCSAVLDRVLDNLKIAIEESGAVVTHDDLPTVMADKTQLIQVFQNLIGNAIKFRSDRPLRIHVGAECLSPPPAGEPALSGPVPSAVEGAGGGRGGGEWLLSVQDNGIGIAPKYFDRIFQIFQRLHDREEYPGTGIGLAVCKKIVERHGGRIWVDSEPSKGSTFYFTIPTIGGKSP